MKPADPMVAGSELVRFWVRCRMLAGHVFVETWNRRSLLPNSMVATNLGTPTFPKGSLQNLQSTLVRRRLMMPTR
jgi:hypothetical protein